WPRVEREIVPYLRSAEKPQFFNSLSIALLPYDLDAAELAPDFDESRNWQPPDLADSERFARLLRIGPITFGFWEDFNSPGDAGFSLGQIRWNPDQVFAVAIDGQHRLAAIKRIADDDTGRRARLAETRVPVILLLFDPAVGYVTPDPDQP